MHSPKQHLVISQFPCMLSGCLTITALGRRSQCSLAIVAPNGGMLKSHTMLLRPGGGIVLFENDHP